MTPFEDIMAQIRWELLLGCIIAFIVIWKLWNIWAAIIIVGVILL